MLEDTHCSTTRIREEEWREGNTGEREEDCGVSVRLYGGWALSFLDELLECGSEYYFEEVTF